MATLHIQHTVSSFDDWKKAFDSDPIGRKDGGVRRYTVSRGVDDGNFVMIDLEFDSTDEATAFEKRLQGLWAGPAKALAQDPRAWLVERVEAADV